MPHSLPPSPPKDGALSGLQDSHSLLSGFGYCLCSYRNLCDLLTLEPKKESQPESRHGSVRRGLVKGGACTGFNQHDRNPREGQSGFRRLLWMVLSRALDASTACLSGRGFQEAHFQMSDLHDTCKHSITGNKQTMPGKQDINGKHELLSLF